MRSRYRGVTRLSREIVVDLHLVAVKAIYVGRQFVRTWNGHGPPIDRDGVIGLGRLLGAMPCSSADVVLKHILHLRNSSLFGLLFVDVTGEFEVQKDTRDDCTLR